MITDINKLDLDGRYTYADYLTWQFKDMVELIRGRVFRMSPAPNTDHQRTSRRLISTIDHYLSGNSCELFHAPFDVRLLVPNSHSTSVDTVVQPDICIICDPAKIDEKGCNGPPDWIIEILSKGTARKDLNEKFELYQRTGVREYWIVHPHDETIITYFLNSQGQYQLTRSTPFTFEEKIPVGIFPGFKVELG